MEDIDETDLPLLEFLNAVKPDLCLEERKRVEELSLRKINEADNPELNPCIHHQGADPDALPDQSLSGFDDESNCQDTSRLIEDTKKRIINIDSVEYDGATYFKGQCYTSKGSDEGRMYAITDFLSVQNSTTEEAKSAWVIEIIEFDKTVLETVYKTDRIKCVRREGSEREMNLTELKKLEEPMAIPEFMYSERQSGSSAQYFGLTNTSVAPKRVGQRDLMKSPLRGIDLYAGAGLMSLGFKKADSNFDVVVAVEKNEDAARSYAKIHNARVRKVSHTTTNMCRDILFEGGKIVFYDTVEAFLERCKDDQSFRKCLGPIDFIIMCSPCQGFSRQNIGKKGNSTQNNHESLRILEAAKLLRPDIIVFENVEGMWEREHIKKYLQEMVYGLLHGQFGYNVKFGKLLAADFGDPQKRVRMILVASSFKVGVPIFPKPTHGYGPSLLPYCTVREALPTEEEMDNNSGDGEKPDLDAPANTVMASKSLPHYSKSRRYTLAENVILMGYDSNLVSKLVAKDTSETKRNESKQRQVGNGVTMRMARAIARSILDTLEWRWRDIDDDDEEHDDDEGDDSDGDGDSARDDNDDDNDPGHDDDDGRDDDGDYEHMTTPDNQVGEPRDAKRTKREDFIRIRVWHDGRKTEN